MGDFPGSVNTHTGGSYNNTQSRGGGAAADGTMVDMAFIRSIPAILMIVEVVLGLIHWALIVSVPILLMPAYGWVLFVAITLWILTIVLYLMILFGVQRQLTVVPWMLTVMVYNAVAAALYLTAFAVNAAHVDVYYPLSSYRNMAAAAFFGFLVLAAYCASTVFAFLDWRADSGRNTAPGNVPT